MGAPCVQWSAATVRNGTLTVPIEGDRPEGWKATFDYTVRLLGNGSWGEVADADARMTSRFRGFDTEA